ncbi:MAG TPA: twin-arginine translocase TatA/TatE family subunit [Solirubrobacterales bacterium]|jgi:sec-independent protein translocase protein TatA
MPHIGPLELAIVLVIALVIFGPKRLPELGRSLGTGMREFKDSVTGKGDKKGEADAAQIGEPVVESVETVDGELVEPSQRA